VEAAANRREEKNVGFIKSKSIVATVALAAGSLVAGAALAATFFTLSPLLYFAAGGGNLSSYLVGFYERDVGEEAELVLVNPTPFALEAFVVLFDDEENPVDCGRLALSPNDVEEFEIERPAEPPFPPEEGVIKVVSFKPGLNSNIRTVQAGLVGWIRHEIEDDTDSDAVAIADTQLASVPVEVLTAQANFELKLIEAYVLENCSG
jgi:hypothetical protein